MKYKTEQKKQLTDFFASHPMEQFSCEDAANALENLGIGKSTVYRLVPEMEKEGLLRRFPKQEGRGSLYQYHHMEDCQSHLHLKCLSCGMLMHLECSLGEELLEHIETEHGFTVDNGTTVIYGLCRECRERFEKEGRMVPSLSEHPHEPHHEHPNGQHEHPHDHGEHSCCHCHKH